MSEALYNAGSTRPVTICCSVYLYISDDKGWDLCSECNTHVISA